MENLLTSPKVLKDLKQRDIYLLLVEGYIHTTTLENNWSTLSKGEDAYTFRPRNFIPKYIMQSIVKHTPEDIIRNIYSGAVCKEKTKIRLKCLSRAKWVNAWDVTQKDNVN